MSWWWFVAVALVVLGVFSNFGLRVAKWVERQASVEPEPEPEPPKAGFFDGPNGTTGLRLADGRVFLTESCPSSDLGWFDPNTGERVGWKVIETAREQIERAERKAKYAGRSA